MEGAEARGTRKERNRREAHPSIPGREDMAERGREARRGGAVDRVIRVRGEAGAGLLRRDQNGHGEATPGLWTSVGSSYEGLANMDFVALNRAFGERTVVRSGTSEGALLDGRDGDARRGIHTTGTGEGSPT